MCRRNEIVDDFSLDFSDAFVVDCEVVELVAVGEE